VIVWPTIIEDTPLLDVHEPVGTAAMKVSGFDVSSGLEHRWDTILSTELEKMEESPLCCSPATCA
jgi:hypothetical protein